MNPTGLHATNKASTTGAAKRTTANKAKSPETRLVAKNPLISNQLTKAVIGKDQHRDDNLHVEAMKFRKAELPGNPDETKEETETYAEQRIEKPLNEAGEEVELHAPVAGHYEKGNLPSTAIIAEAKKIKKELDALNHHKTNFKRDTNAGVDRIMATAGVPPTNSSLAAPKNTLQASKSSQQMVPNNSVFMRLSGSSRKLEIDTEPKAESGIGSSKKIPVPDTKPKTTTNARRAVSPGPILMTKQTSQSKPTGVTPSTTKPSTTEPIKRIGSGRVIGKSPERDLKKTGSTKNLADTSTHPTISVTAPDTTHTNQASSKPSLPPAAIVHHTAHKNLTVDIPNDNNKPHGTVDHTQEAQNKKPPLPTAANVHHKEATAEHTQVADIKKPSLPSAAKVHHNEVTTEHTQVADVKKPPLPSAAHVHHKEATAEHTQVADIKKPSLPSAAKVHHNEVTTEHTQVADVKKPPLPSAAHVHHKEATAEHTQVADIKKPSLPSAAIVHHKEVSKDVDEKITKEAPRESSKPPIKIQNQSKSSSVEKHQPKETIVPAKKPGLPAAAHVNHAPKHELDTKAEPDASGKQNTNASELHTNTAATIKASKPVRTGLVSPPRGAVASKTTAATTSLSKPKPTLLTSTSATKLVSSTTDKGNPKSFVSTATPKGLAAETKIKIETTPQKTQIETHEPTTQTSVSKPTESSAPSIEPTSKAGTHNPSMIHSPKITMKKAETPTQAAPLNPTQPSGLVPKIQSNDSSPTKVEPEQKQPSTQATNKLPEPIKPSVEPQPPIKPSVESQLPVKPTVEPQPPVPKLAQTTSTNSKQTASTKPTAPQRSGSGLVTATNPKAPTTTSTKATNPTTKPAVPVPKPTASSQPNKNETPKSQSAKTDPVKDAPTTTPSNPVSNFNANAVETTVKTPTSQKEPISNQSLFSLPKPSASLDNTSSTTVVPKDTEFYRQLMLHAPSFIIERSEQDEKLHSSSEPDPKEMFIPVPNLDSLFAKCDPMPDVLTTKVAPSSCIVVDMSKLFNKTYNTDNMDDTNKQIAHEEAREKILRSTSKPRLQSTILTQVTKEMGFLTQISRQMASTSPQKGGKFNFMSPATQSRGGGLSTPGGSQSTPGGILTNVKQIDLDKNIIKEVPSQGDTSEPAKVLDYYIDDSRDVSQTSPGKRAARNELMDAMHLESIIAILEHAAEEDKVRQALQAMDINEILCKIDDPKDRTRVNNAFEGQNLHQVVDILKKTSSRLYAEDEKRTASRKNTVVDDKSIRESENFDDDDSDDFDLEKEYRRAVGKKSSPQISPEMLKKKTSKQDTQVGKGSKPINSSKATLPSPLIKVTATDQDNANTKGGKPSGNPFKTPRNIVLDGELHKADHVRLDDSFGESFEDAHSPKDSSAVDNLTPYVKSTKTNPQSKLTLSPDTKKINSAVKTSNAPVSQSQKQIPEVKLSPRQAQPTTKKTESPTRSATIKEKPVATKPEPTANNQSGSQSTNVTEVKNSSQIVNQQAELKTQGSGEKPSSPTGNVLIPSGSRKLIKQASSEKVIGDIRHSLIDDEKKTLIKSGSNSALGKSNSKSNLSSSLHQEFVLHDESPVKKQAQPNQINPISRSTGGAKPPINVSKALATTIPKPTTTTSKPPVPAASAKKEVLKPTQKSDEKPKSSTIEQPPQKTTSQLTSNQKPTVPSFKKSPTIVSTSSVETISATSKPTITLIQSSPLGSKQGKQQDLKISTQPVPQDKAASGQEHAEGHHMFNFGPESNPNNKNQAKLDRGESRLELTNYTPEMSKEDLMKKFEEENRMMLEKLNTDMNSKPHMSHLVSHSSYNVGQSIGEEDADHENDFGLDLPDLNDVLYDMRKAEDKGAMDDGQSVVSERFKDIKEQLPFSKKTSNPANSQGQTIKSPPAGTNLINKHKPLKSSTMKDVEDMYVSMTPNPRLAGRLEKQSEIDQEVKGTYLVV